MTRRRSVQGSKKEGKKEPTITSVCYTLEVRLESWQLFMRNVEAKAAKHGMVEWFEHAEMSSRDEMIKKLK